MSNVCSKHKEYVPSCLACNAQPWDVLGTTKEDWEEHVRDAKSEGVLPCPKCGFVLYRKGTRRPDGRYMCVACGRYFILDEEGDKTDESTS